MPEHVLKNKLILDHPNHIFYNMEHTPKILEGCERTCELWVLGQDKLAEALVELLGKRSNNLTKMAELIKKPKTDLTELAGSGR